MPFDKEKDLQMKYTYVDGENDTKYKKKSRRKAPKKADHKHTYENCVIDFIYPKTYPVQSLAGKPGQVFESYCTVCGKIGFAQEDKRAEELFPHIHLGYFGLIATQKGREDEVEAYRKYCDENYRHFYIEDYMTIKPQYVPMTD